MKSFESNPLVAPARAETSVTPNPEREKVLERRARTLLVCPDNDPESRMLQDLARRMDMAVLSSKQMHGATLEKEEDFMVRVAAAHKGEVWIVEMPGPELEEQLREQGQSVHVIDHHTYGTLDRANDPKTGERRRSSLEQFLDEAGLTDEEIQQWGYDPKTVRGLGIFDDRFAQGLRDAGYTQQEIAAVVDLGTKLSREMNPVFDEIAQAAELDWDHREDWNGYILVRSEFKRDVRGAISHRTIREGVDTQPLIVSSCGGRKIFIHNLAPALIDRLKTEIPSQDTFTFGAGRCWGYDNRGRGAVVTLDEILSVLSKGERG